MVVRDPEVPCEETTTLHKKMNNIQEGVARGRSIKTNLSISHNYNIILTILCSLTLAVTKRPSQILAVPHMHAC